ncbi:hypothetical protein GOBAR_DD35921 [Gossypium barbadense]|nr:hypothetical protein GOBAR_DD35921 [Gossypium barbadense]
MRRGNGISSHRREIFLVWIFFLQRSPHSLARGFLVDAAVAGILPVIALKISDKSGVTVQDALKGDSIEITEDSLLGLKYDPTPIWGYFELHIEQEPVLE